MTPTTTEGPGPSPAGSTVIRARAAASSRAGATATSRAYRPVVGRSRPRQPPRPRTAFVLAGGASLGALHAGTLRALYERGVTADLLVGTSAGALNAAYVASRPQTAQTAKELARVWRELRREDIFPIHPRTLIAGLANQRDHLVPDRGIRGLISRHLQLERLEQASTPLHVVTFDLLTGEEVRLSEGSAATAVLAASAIPGVLAPVPWGERLLVDGGVINNTPISHAVELGAERIYVLPTQDPTERGLPQPPRGALDGAVHAFMLLTSARLEADLARYARAAEIIVLPAANPTRVQPADFDHADSLIAEALRAARAALSEAPVPQESAA